MSKKRAVCFRVSDSMVYSPQQTPNKMYEDFRKPSGLSKGAPNRVSGRAEMRPLKVLVVDDCGPIRELICSILQQEMKTQVVLEQASDGLEGVQKARELQADLILLDLGLPKMNGVEAAKQMRRLTPHSRILCVSQESDSDIVREMLRLGASGYVHKPRTREELVSAIEAVLAGKQFVSDDIEGLDCDEKHPGEASQLE